LTRRIEGLERFTRAYRMLARLPDPVPTPVAMDAAATCALSASETIGDRPLSSSCPRISIISLSA
jgi:hypothetical protein